MLDGLLNALLAFLGKLFAPTTPSRPPVSPVSAPSSAPVTPPMPIHPDAVAALVLAENNRWPFIAGVLENPLKGTILHKIGSSDASLISDMVTEQSNEHNIPIPYLLACLSIESVFDPHCQNANLTGSNPHNDPLGYDMGIAQLKLRYLIGQDGVKDADTAKAFAFNVEQAVAYFARVMRGLLDWAPTVDLSGSQYDPRSHNPYFFATCAYNYGRTGVLTVLASGQPITHGDHVVNLERAYSSKLSIPSVFTDIN